MGTKPAPVRSCFWSLPLHSGHKPEKQETGPLSAKRIDAPSISASGGGLSRDEQKRGSEEGER